MCCYCWSFVASYFAVIVCYVLLVIYLECQSLIVSYSVLLLYIGYPLFMFDDNYLVLVMYV